MKTASIVITLFAFNSFAEPAADDSRPAIDRKSGSQIYAMPLAPVGLAE
jgi:hypothetical protein